MVVEGGLRRSTVSSRQHLSSSYKQNTLWTRGYNISYKSVCLYNRKWNGEKEVSYIYTLVSVSVWVLWVKSYTSPGREERLLVPNT